MLWFFSHLDFLIESFILFLELFVCCDFLSDRTIKFFDFLLQLLFIVLSVWNTLLLCHNNMIFFWNSALQPLNLLRIFFMLRELIFEGLALTNLSLILVADIIAVFVEFVDIGFFKFNTHLYFLIIVFRLLYGSLQQVNLLLLAFYLLLKHRNCFS